MILLTLDDRTIARAKGRALREGWPDLETLIRQLVSRYAQGKDAAMGGYKRAAMLTQVQRTESARHAALARWGRSTPEEREVYARLANEARWEPQRRLLALARSLTEPARRRVPGWPFAEDDGEEY